MIVRRMREGADQRPQSAPLGQHRQMLANLNSWRPRRDRLELAPDLLGRIGLQVERVLMCQAARQVDHDDRFVRPAGPEPGVRLGAHSVVGAGAVVTRDVAAGDVVVGNPARVLRTRDLTDREEEPACPHC